MMMETSARVFEEISPEEKDQLDRKKKKAKMNDNSHRNMQARECRQISYKDTSMGSHDDPITNNLMRMIGGI